jgi:phenylpyruvate tautomerase PptA (4-oxalocrotonate tautomerase family)
VNDRMTHLLRRLAAATTLLAVTAAGCDDRATQIALEAADRQADQYREMAQLNQRRPESVDAR